MLAKHLPRHAPAQCQCRCGLAWLLPRRGRQSFTSSSSSSSGSKDDRDGTSSSNNNSKPPQRTTTTDTTTTPANSNPSPPKEPHLDHLKAHLAKLQLPDSLKTRPPVRRLLPRLPSSAGPPPSELARIKKDLAALSLHQKPQPELEPRSDGQNPSQPPPPNPWLVSPWLSDEITWPRNNDHDTRSRPPPDSTTTSSPSSLLSSPSLAGLHLDFLEEHDDKSADDSADIYKTWMNTVLAKDRAKATEKEATVDPATLLLLLDVSPSLVHSDFFRIGQQGKHIGGWTSGLQEVIQRIDPETLRPLGEYILHFSTKAAAALWADDATRRRRLAAHLHTTSHSAAILADKSDSAAALGFSLIYPSNSEHVAPLRGSGRGSVMLAYMRSVALRRLLRSELHSSALVVVGIEGETTHPDARWDAKPATMSSTQLRRIVQDDAAEHGFQWPIVRAREWRGGTTDDGGDKTVKKTTTDGRDKTVEKTTNDVEDKTRGKTTTTDRRPSGGASRFVVSFTTDDEAHRFVRWWHRREIQREAPVSGPVTFDVHSIGRV